MPIPTLIRTLISTPTPTPTLGRTPTRSDAPARRRFSMCDDFVYPLSYLMWACPRSVVTENTIAVPGTRMPVPDQIRAFNCARVEDRCSGTQQGVSVFVQLRTIVETPPDATRSEKVVILRRRNACSWTGAASSARTTISPRVLSPTLPERGENRTRPTRIEASWRAGRLSHAHTYGIGIFIGL